MRNLTADLSGRDSVMRVRKAVEAAGGDDPITRERLAKTLARHGAFAEAVEAYLWCLDVGLQKHLSYAAARRRSVLKAFVAMTDKHPSARKAIEERRNAIERTLLTTRDDANLARNLAELNRCLGDEARNLSLYDRLPRRSRARRILFDRVLHQLVEHKRYDEVLATLDPMTAFIEETRLARFSGIPNTDGPEARLRRGTRAFAVTRGTVLVEALAGNGRVSEARALIDRILGVDSSAHVRERLNHHIRRTHSPELIEYIESKSVSPDHSRKRPRN